MIEAPIQCTKKERWNSAGWQILVDGLSEIKIPSGYYLDELIEHTSLRSIMNACVGAGTASESWFCSLCTLTQGGERDLNAACQYISIKIIELIRISSCYSLFVECILQLVESWLVKVKDNMFPQEDLMQMVNPSAHTDVLNREVIIFFGWAVKNHWCIRQQSKRSNINKNDKSG